jgi:hypothetical protein
VGGEDGEQHPEIEGDDRISLELEEARSLRLSFLAPAVAALAPEAVLAAFCICLSPGPRRRAK